MLKIGTLQPSIQPLALRLLELSQERGIPLEIVQAERSMQQQAEIYAQGRTQPGPVVTNAKPGDSYHNYGLAFDVVPTVYKSLPDWNPSGSLWQTIGEIGEGLGLEWGGRWRTPDKPHFQIPSSLAPLSVLKDYWKKFQAVMPVKIEPSTAGLAMMVLVTIGAFLFARWARTI